MTKHTPGPWRLNEAAEPTEDAEGVFDWRRFVYSAKPLEMIVAEVIAPTKGEVDDAARLIAAAPELYEALKACLLDLGDENPDDDWRCLRDARAVLAKVEDTQ